MHRTQLYLEEMDRVALDRVSTETGASRSELIRRAVRKLYLTPMDMTPQNRVAAAKEAFGIWADRDETTDQVAEDLNRMPPSE